MSLAREIACRMTGSELLAQMAEECAELGHAALKLRRAITGDNPTPVSADAASAQVEEELADVLTCWAALKEAYFGDDADMRIADIAEEKARRWLERLKNRED
jgi:NTP pyrophosphatase (non-canonical NTP hydrolase)